MTNYPDAIDTFREVENIRGVTYSAEDTQTLFAEDTNNHSDAIIAIETTLGENPQGDFDTVADRLNNSGGGGGAWEFVTEVIAGATNDKLIINGLDLAADEAYLLYTSLQNNAGVSNIEFHGSTVITMSVQQTVFTGSAVIPTTGLPNTSHPSLGPGVGSMLLQKTPNGSLAIDGAWTQGNGRGVRTIGMDASWYTGGPNLTQIRVFAASGNFFVPGSKLTLYKRKK